VSIDLLIRAIAIGLGATLVMDLWAVLLNRAFAIPAPNQCLVGRWLLHMTKGVFSHPGISNAARRPGECPIGWLAHYTIGAVFALGLMAFTTPQWLKSPSLMPALIFGVVTVGFPFLILHPAFGLGVAASKAPAPMQARIRSLMNHAVFGVGLYLAAMVVTWVVDR